MNRCIEYASALRRLVAYTIDLIVSSLLTTPLFIWYGKGLFSDQSGLYLLGYSTYLLMGVLLMRLLYLGIGWHYQSKTIGCLLMRIRVVTMKEERISFRRAFIRYIGLLVSILFFGIGCLPIFFTTHHQCLHDLLAKTIVLTTDKKTTNTLF
jgi:uncharacterized RDD family membrane protein YckC